MRACFVFTAFLVTVAAASCGQSSSPNAVPSSPDATASTDAEGTAPEDARAPAAEGGPPIPATNREDTPIDNQWKFTKSDAAGAEQTAFDDAAWSAVDLPHTWNAIDGQDGPQTPYYRGIGWYRRHLAIDAKLTGRKIYLQFDGANIIAKVYLNGTLLGTHAGGFAAFRFDITEAAHVGGDNVLAVQVDNSAGVDATGNVILPTGNVPPLSADFTFFGGIYRDVHLLTTDPLAISVMDSASSGVYIDASPNGSSADIKITTKVSNGAKGNKAAEVVAKIYDATTALVQTLTAPALAIPGGNGADAVLTGKLDSPHLWNGLAAPYLYNVVVELHDGAGGPTTDAIAQPMGIRSMALDPNTGFSLNGAPLSLHGVDMHQDAKDKGWALEPADTDAKMAFVTEIGANVVRLAHYQHSQHTYDLTDRLGIVVWAETPVVNRINDSPEFAANAKQQLVELIRQNYNHPSIAFWSIGNETLLRPGPNPDALLQSLADVAHAEDPSRMNAYAANGGADDNPANWHCIACGFNEYQGWYYGVPADFAGWADGIHAAHPSNAVGLTEYGAGANPTLHALPIVLSANDHTTGAHTEEYQAFFHETFWKAISTRPFLWGTFVWNLFDFASDGRNEGLTPGLNDKGLITYDHQTKKDAFYWYKVNWSKDSTVYITSRRFATLPKSSADIRVYSNLDSVELTLNGTSLGSKAATDHIFIWKNVPWKAGDNVAEAHGGTGAGSAAVSDSVTWTN